MAEKFWFPSRSQPNPLLHSVDRSGRPIHPDVLSIAESIALRALQFAEGLLKDPALATTLLEESAASVSRVVRQRAQLGKPPITNLEAYLFRAFIRRVNLARRKEIAVSSAITLANASPDGAGYSDKLELRILVDEFVTRCDPVTRDMFYRRVQGFSWKEIGRAYDISAHAAEARFSQQLKKIRRRLGLG
jgi:DNA-directed RNA polymerase specialized sigma24 family protein